ncbi:clostripain-related cysteine peptidase [Lachnoclostridium phytofermentans]|uniref:Alpha-clostripain-like protein n=1 Tax=Lachnoclostridium phytofermentans (strain ATCC 700394 / DSM 18823 / ISDg) TaxID=357809 RepID=A9KNZ8_LACP7|nr:clostripain-related cysteine peptidase [Lachnoclostridium phytofermentans]ABX43168.1 alpha-clostripain-like protein [Lachnoclostridium phytofermentans ISDg]
MQNDQQKEWTILFYLNGNNELQPEMLQSKLFIEKEGSDGTVNIVIQYSFVEKHIIEIIRPKYRFNNDAEGQSGVIRYSAAGPDSTFHEELRNINMADPMCFYNFLEWGITNYPAQKYILVLGGHVFQYIGLMPDYSQDLPYLMGYPEMVNVLNLIKKNIGKKIDLLVLDTCYVNRIEMLYELGKEPDPPVSNVLTYINGGPASGLPYDLLIKTIKKINSTVTDKFLLSKLMENLNYDLIAYEIDHNKLESIKNLYSDLADCRLNFNSSSCSFPYELLTNVDENLPWFDLRKKLQDYMPELTICYNNISRKPFGHFYVSAQTISDQHKIDLYHRLAFAKKNSWSKLLYGLHSPINTSDEAETNVHPTILKSNDLYALISAMNPNLGLNENNEILSKLIEYKGWKWKN